MATLQVQSNGNAPSNAKVGDHIVTAGGTYQVLDSAQYQGKSPEELASAGVGYNPSSGLYSKKISDVTNYTGSAQSTIPQLSLRTSDTARLMTNQQNQKVSADLDSAYYQNRQDAYNSYMDAITRQNQQANDVNQAYLDNISKLYDDTYRNNNAVLERMASRGLTSSGLGNAMQVSALANASKQNADYRAQRNRDLNNIETQMNNLTNQYNVNLDTLAKKLRSDKISALSQNEIAFLEAVMDIEEYNANAENTALTTQQQQAYEAEQALLQREFQASESELDRQLQRELQAASLLGGSGGGYGGYGGYRRGGYSSRGYGGYSSGGSSGSSGTALQQAAASYLNAIYSDPNIDHNTKVSLAEGIANNSNGTIASAMISAKRQERGETLQSSSKSSSSSNSPSKRSNITVGAAGSVYTTGNKRGQVVGSGSSSSSSNKNKKKSKKSVKKNGSAGGLF